MAPMERTINNLNCRYEVHLVLKLVLPIPFTINNFYVIKESKFPNDVN
jgi:hypothetical protein